MRSKLVHDHDLGRKEWSHHEVFRDQKYWSSFLMDLQRFNWQGCLRIVPTEQARPWAKQSTEMGKRGEKQGNASPAEIGAECSFLVVGSIQLARYVRVRWVILRSGFYSLHGGRWLHVAKRGVMWSKQGFGGLDVIPKQEGLKEETQRS